MKQKKIFHPKKRFHKTTLYHEDNKIARKPNTDGIINKLVMVFAFAPAPLTDL